jgi:hypothetical protein
MIYSTLRILNRALAAISPDKRQSTVKDLLPRVRTHASNIAKSLQIWVLACAQNGGAFGRTRTWLIRTEKVR